MPTLLGDTDYKSEKSVFEENTEKVFFVDENAAKLAELERRANIIIFETQTVAPGILKNSSDKITICTNRITVTKSGWFTTEEYPMPVESVTGASVYRHLMFASLSIETFGVPKPDPLTRLNINDARLARRYILALVECKKNGIDLSKFEVGDLRERLKNIGTVHYGMGEDYHNI